jgi:hypothetical protein
MLSRLPALAVGLAVVAAPVGYAADDKKDDGWVQLFNGKDLTGWKLFDPPAGGFEKGVIEKKNADGKVIALSAKTKPGRGQTESKEITLWEVKDGTIVGGGPMSHLYSDAEAEDFVFRVEAKINDKGNSGMFFRSGFRSGVPKGYEAQINATGGDPIKTGSLYPNGEFKLDKFKKEIAVVLNTAPHKADEFFTQEVTCVADEVTIKVNGKETLKWKDPNKTFSKGHFALQGHDPGSVMTFRKVEYKPLKK